MISEAILNQVLDRADIVEIVGSRIPLKRAGRNFKACCPFHHEKTPSFLVSSDKQIYHCFGCGAGGNVFSFLMKYEKRDFRDVVEAMADSVGIEVPQDRAQKDFSDRYAVYYLAQAQAADYFHQTLLKSPAAQTAREYFERRQIQPQTIEAFKLGYALDAWDGLYQALKGKVSDEVMERSGLVLARKDASGYYDRFRRRVIFPIMDAKGACIAFGGRVLDESLPKYLNSPETDIYFKGRNLYGLAQAKPAIRQHDFAVMVEGYMDVIMCHQAGVQNVVASCGTAVTIEQARLLKRQSPNIVIVYDADKAGEMATLRGLEIFLAEGMEVKITRLPEGHDPDSFVRQEGAEGFLKRLKEAVPIFDYKLAKLKEQYDARVVEGKVRIANEMVSLFIKAPSEILKSAWTKALAAELSLSEEALTAEMKKSSATAARRHLPQQPVAQPVTASIEGVPAAERLLIGLLMDSRDFQGRARKQLSMNDFESGGVRAIAQRLLSEEDAAVSPTAFMNLFSDNPGMIGFVSRAAAEAENAGDREKAFADCVAHLMRRRLRVQREDLLGKIREAERQGDQRRVSQYMSDLHELNKKEKGIHEKK